MVEILRSRDQTGPLWWRFSSAIVALYSLIILLHEEVKMSSVEQSDSSHICKLQVVKKCILKKVFC